MSSVNQNEFKAISYLHDGTIGDVWASLASIQQGYKVTGRKAVLYLTNGREAFYYKGATHPTYGEDGVTNVMLNEATINMMIPLLKEQDYIADAKIHSNQPISVDLNKIRKTFVNQPYHSLAKWYHYVFPQLACDLSKPYITVPDTDKDFAKGKIIVTRSERYLNPQVNYVFLKKFEQDILFCGTEIEYQIFKLRYKLNIERLVINDFLELAQALKQCRFHITNQTQAAQISEGMKTPRMVELCEMAPNVDFVGENAFEYYSQASLEYYANRLSGETQKTQTNGSFVPPMLSFNG